MSEPRQVPRKALIGVGRLGKSIFPTFDVNVPMPPGTAVPPAAPWIPKLESVPAPPPPQEGQESGPAGD
jgi:hypothetical protein